MIHPPAPCSCLPGELPRASDLGAWRGLCHWKSLPGIIWMFVIFPPIEMWWWLHDVSFNYFGLTMKELQVLSVSLSRHNCILLFHLDKRTVTSFCWPGNSYSFSIKRMPLRDSSCPLSSSWAVSSQCSCNSSLFIICLDSGKLFWNHSPCLDLGWRAVLARHLQEQPHLNKRLRLEIMSLLLVFFFWGTKVKLQVSYSWMCKCNGGV